MFQSVAKSCSFVLNTRFHPKYYLHKICCRYRSCSKFFIRKSTTLLGDIPCPTAPLDDVRGLAVSFFESDKAFTIATAAPLIASLNDSLRALFGSVPENAGQSGGLS